MLRYCLLMVLTALMLLKTHGQCTTGGAVWLNGENNGIMKDTGLIGGYVTVIASTQGTMTNGRPLYQIGSSTWKGLSYASLQVWRAYSLPGTNYTYFKLDSPLDSTNMHIRVDNIRGDLFNWEAQSVRGYLNGVQVAASFKDPVNGATNSGNTINGATNTNTTTQSAMRVFFHGPVDSIVVQQVSVSDWIIAELMIECNVLLPIELLNWTAENRSSAVLLNWKTAFPPRDISSFVIERSFNGISFLPIGQVNAVPNILSYQFEDQLPDDGKNFYRLKTIDKDGKRDYSNIIYVNRKRYDKPLVEIYPNPANSFFNILTSRLSSVTIFSIDGREIKYIAPFLGTTQVNCASWPRGEYIVRAENNGEVRTEKIVIR